MVFRWLAVGVAVVHAAYLVYLVVGGYLAWRFPKTFFLHLVAAVWAVVIVAMSSLPCPLTTLQNALRVHGGQPPLSGVFLDVYVRDVLYPAKREYLVFAAVAVIVAVSWLVLALRLRRRPRRPRRPK